MDNPYMIISIPRANWRGTWDSFVREHGAFFSDGELTRIGRELDTNGVAAHRALSAGEFVFVKEKAE